MSLESPIDRYLQDRLRSSGSRSNWEDILKSVQQKSYSTASLPLGAIAAANADQQKVEDGGGFVGGLKKAGLTALQTVGGVLDLPRELVIGTGVGIWNSGISPIAGAIAGDGADAWQVDVNDDGDNNDTLFDQWGKALSTDESVVGMGRLVPGLQMEKDDSTGIRALKGLGAFAGDLVTDPTTFIGGASKAIGLGERATLAATNVAEVASKEIGQTISKEAAEKLAARSLAREGTAALKARAAQLVEEGVADSVIQTAGKSADDIAASLVRRYGEEEVAKIAGQELGYGAQAALRNSRGVGLGNYLQDELGKEAADALIPKLDSRVLNRLQARIPLLGIESTVGEGTGKIFGVRAPGFLANFDGGGAGSLLGRIPGMGQTVETYSRAMNLVRAPLSLGRYSSLVKDARMAAFRAGAGHVGDAAIAAEKRLYDIKVLLGREVSDTEGLVRRAQSEWVVTAQAAQKKWKGQADEFAERYKHYWQHEDDLANMPVPEQGTLDYDAFNTALAHRKLDSTYVTYKEMFERSGGKSRIGGDVSEAIDNEFSKHGIIEGPRRILTAEGRKYVERLSKAGRQVVESASAGGGKRTAFQVLDEEGNFVRWLDPVEVSKEMGFDFFETDPFKVGMITSERTRRAVGKAAARRFLQDAGLATQLYKTPYGGTSFFIDKTKSRVDELVKRSDGGFKQAASKETKAANKRAAADAARARGESILEKASQPTPQQAARIAANPTDERLAELAAEREALDTRILEVRAEAQGLAEPIASKGKGTVAALVEREQVLKSQKKELASLRKAEVERYTKDLAEQRSAARAAKASATKAKNAATAEQTAVQKEHLALVKAAEDRRKEATAQLKAAKKGGGNVSAAKEAEAAAKAEVEAAKAAKAEAMGNHAAAVAGAKEREGLAAARVQMLSEAEPPTAHKAVLGAIDDQTAEVDDLLEELGLDLGAKKNAVETVLEQLGVEKKAATGLLGAAKRQRKSAEATAAVLSGASVRQQEKLARAAERATAARARGEVLDKAADATAAEAAIVKANAQKLLKDGKHLRKYMEHVATLPSKEQAAAYEGLLHMLAQTSKDDVANAEKLWAETVAKAAADPENVKLVEAAEKAKSVLESAQRKNFDDVTLPLDPAALNNDIRLSGDYVRIGSIKRNGKEIEVDSAVRDLWADPIAAAALTRHFRLMNKSDVLPERFTVFARSLESLWKTSATLGRGPSFVIRNLLGGMYNAWLGGTTAADMVVGRNYVKELKSAVEDAAVKAARDGIPAEEVGQFLDTAIRERLSTTEVHGTNLWDIHVEMERRNVMGSQLQMTYDDEDSIREFIRTGLERRDLSAGLSEEEMFRVEKAYYSFFNGAINSRPLRYAASKQESVERFLRASQYVAGIRQAGTGATGHHYAELLVKATQFDYTDLSKFEQRVLRHVFPFFTFTKNNVPLQLRSLIQSPGKVNALLRANYYAQQAFGGDSETAKAADDNRPEWLRESEGWASRFNVGGGPVMAGIGAPLADLNRFIDLPEINSVGDLAAAPFRLAAGASEESTAQITPAAKLVIEHITGQNMYTGSKYKDAKASWLMQQLPFMGNKSIDPVTGEARQSGFAAQQYLNFLPPLGQAQRLLPFGPLAADRYKERLFTSLTGAGLGLSGLPVAPLATANEEQVTNWIDQNTDEMATQVRNKYLEAGLDWGSISRARGSKSWEMVANQIAFGKHLAPFAQAELAQNGSLSPETLARIAKIVELMKAADQND